MSNEGVDSFALFSERVGIPKIAQRVKRKEGLGREVRDDDITEEELVLWEVERGLW